jgi:ABC-2 type transport system permease protein
VTRLLRVELARFRARQAIVLLVLAGALVSAVLAVVVAWDTRPLSDSDRADATAQAQLESERPAVRDEVDACKKDPAAYLGPTSASGDCEDALVPGVDSYYPRQELSLRSVLDQNGIHLAVGLVALVVVAASTFAGADWGSGSITNQLLFEPRRLRLWTAKALAAALSCGVVVLVVLGAFWLALGLVASSRGVGVPGNDVTLVAWHLARAVALAMAAAVGSFAMTMIFRHTVATLALLFVYSVGGEILVNLLPFEGAGRFAVGNNIYGWLGSHHRYFDPTISCSPGEPGCTSTPLMTHLASGTFLGVLVVVAVLLSLVVFRRRDV